jgi:hypothetical protein
VIEKRKATGGRVPDMSIDLVRKGCGSVEFEEYNLEGNLALFRESAAFDVPDNTSGQAFAMKKPFWNNALSRFCNLC